MWRAIISSSLVGITQADAFAPVALMRPPPRGLGVCIHVDAQRRRIAADALANRRRVVADAGGEDQAIEPTEHSGQRPSSRRIR